MCEDVVRVAVDFYKSEMQVTADEGYGYVHMTYTFDGIEMSSDFNLIGFKLKNSLLALDETGEKPVLLNHKFDSDKNLIGIDVYDFSNWRDFVLVIEPEVIKHWRGQYKLYDAADLAIISNKKIYKNNRENALEVDEINLKLLFVLINSK
ncbi:MAG: hypothetical protein P8P88_08480 [Polaribacter sp.]|nr:hypothetical protein [Polaribacter sp.]